MYDQFDEIVDQLIEIMIENRFEVVTILIIGSIFGILISIIFWKRQINKRDRTIWNLEASIEEKEVDVNRLKLAQEILKNQFETIEGLHRQFAENKRNHNQLNHQYNEKITIHSKVKAQLQDREKYIKNLNNQVNEKDKAIELLQNTVAKLEETNQEAANRIEQLNTNLTEVKQCVEDKNLEISSITARMSFMQDDFTHIVGIGPKISSVLMSAGINNFSKLGSINLERLSEILEAENPNLLRLLDPSTWSEQAKVAMEEDWEVLSKLQESVKGIRRKRK